MIFLLLDRLQINALFLIVPDKKASSASEESSANYHYPDTLQDFWMSVTDCKDVLDEAITINVLGREGVPCLFVLLK